MVTFKTGDPGPQHQERLLLAEHLDWHFDGSKIQPCVLDMGIYSLSAASCQDLNDIGLQNMSLYLRHRTSQEQEHPDMFS